MLLFLKTPIKPPCQNLHFLLLFSGPKRPYLKMYVWPFWTLCVKNTTFGHKLACFCTFWGNLSHSASYGVTAVFIAAFNVFKGTVGNESFLRGRVELALVRWPKNGCWPLRVSKIPLLDTFMHNFAHFRVTCTITFCFLTRNGVFIVAFNVFKPSGGRPVHFGGCPTSRPPILTISVVIPTIGGPESPRFSVL